MTVGLVGLFLLLLFPQAAHANIGLPMVMVTTPYMLVALAPVILVESFVIAKLLQMGISVPLRSVAFANVFTTVVGCPLTWFMLVMLELLIGGGSAYGLDTPTKRLLAVTLQAPWLIPYESHFGWMIPSAMLVLLVPFFVASFGIEFLVLARDLTFAKRHALMRAAFIANAVSYGLLAIYPLYMLLHALGTGWGG